MVLLSCPVNLPRQNPKLLNSRRKVVVKCRLTGSNNTAENKVGRAVKVVKVPVKVPAKVVVVASSDMVVVVAKVIKATRAGMVAKVDMAAANRSKVNLPQTVSSPQLMLKPSR